jgi:hypothetical protein
MTIVAEKYTGNVRYTPEAGVFFTKSKIFVEVEIERAHEQNIYDEWYFELKEWKDTIWRPATLDDLQFLYTKGTK